jgi:hypothetical protein
MVSEPASLPRDLEVLEHGDGIRVATVRLGTPRSQNPRCAAGYRTGSGRVKHYFGHCTWPSSGTRSFKSGVSLPCGHKGDLFRTPYVQWAARLDCRGPTPKMIDVIRTMNYRWTTWPQSKETHVRKLPLRARSGPIPSLRFARPCRSLGCSRRASGASEGA